MSNVIIVASLLGVMFFPTDGGFQTIIATITFLIILPVLFIRFFLKEELSLFGTSWGNVTQGMFWLVLSLIFVIGSFAGLYRYTSVLSQINVPLLIRQSFSVFLIYAVSTAILFGAQEFFFRGFILNVYRKIFGYKAIAAQAIFAIILSLVKTNGLGIETGIISLFAMYSGWMAYRSQSIWYSFLFFLTSAILGIAVVLVFIK
jgi:membrane protease YdiL (CAAX protease family)